MTTAIANRPTVDAVLAQLRSFDRDPFAIQLAQLLDCAPTPKAIRAYAKKYPDRWAQTVAIFSRLTGFTEKTEVVNNNLFVTVGSMSDAELEQRLRLVLPKLAMKQGQIIDGTATPAIEPTSTQNREAGEGRDTTNAGARTGGGKG